VAQAGKTFEVKFTGDTTNLSKSFQKLQRDAGVLGKSVSASSGLMKTALAAVSVGAFVSGMKSAVMAASTLSESIAKADVVFGKNAEAVQKWSKTTAKALGISRQASLEAAATYGNLFRAFGLTEEQSFSMSTSLVQLAADMASFNNTSVDDALLALRSGLSGETEPLKRYGIALTDVRLKEQAMAMGLIKTTSGTLPQAIKTQAAYALVMKDTALAQGDITRTADGLANQLRFLQAGLQDAKAGFGEALLPAALSVVSAFNDKLLPAIGRIVDAIKFQGAEGGLKTLGVEISNVLTNLTGTAKVVKDLILIFIGIKVVAPLVLALRAAWITVGTTIGATATLTQIATGVMQRALASTGIGLLIVAAGILVSKIIEMRLEASATDKTIYIMESNGVRAFNRMGQAANGTIISINAVALAASKAADELDNAGIQRVKQGRVPPVAVSVPDTNTGLTGAAGKATKAATAVKGLSEAAKAAQTQMGKLSDELNRNNDALTKAKDAYNSFKDGIKNVINGIIDFGSAATAETGTFLENLVAQAAKAADFGAKVKQLLAMGLSESAIGQVLAAGADAGTKIADEIIAGGATVVDQVNTLVSATQSVADAVGEAGATQFYEAGITAGQALVEGVRSAIAAAGFAINVDGSLTNQGAIDQVNAAIGAARSGKTKKQQKISKKERQSIMDLAASLGIEVPAFATGGIVNKPTLALIGEAGPEAVVPLSGRNAGMGATINLTVNAGMGADGASIGREIVDIIKRYERVSGPVFASA